MAATGFSFGAPAATKSNLFGAKPAGSIATTGFGFGTTATTQNNFFGAKTTAATGFSFSGFGTTTTTATPSLFGGGTKSTTTTLPTFGSSLLGSQNKTTASSGFSFGSTTTATAGNSLFGSLAKTTASTGFGLFGANTTSTPSTFGLGGKTTFGFGASSSGFPLASTSIATTAAVTKPVGNPKEEKVPTELTALTTDLETFIKTQKDLKEEISKISSEEISKTKENILGLKQGLALIANGLQRDSVAVENLKREVGQELKNAEIAHRIKDVAASLQHDFSAPMEYFTRLIYSFETRMNCYRKEIEELETFLSTSSPRNDFTPQDLSNVLKRVNESFVGLASGLQQVHEAVKDVKDKYIHFRRVAYSDFSDPFSARKKIQDKGSNDLVGPSPFPVVQGAGIMASAFQTENKAPSGGLMNPIGFGSAFSKPAGSGLTRSLSFGGTAKSSGFGLGASLGGSSLFNKTATGTTAGLNLAVPSNTSSSFILQKPPSGKRGKLF